MDPLGQAIHDYYWEKRNTPMRVWINEIEDTPLYPVIFFRTLREINHLERKAISLCTGKTLDIGAGAGCHSLILQKDGNDVVALDNSMSSCNVMKERGLETVVHSDIMKYAESGYDTLLLLMNGFGLARSESALVAFLLHLKSLLGKGGKIIGESTDIFYIIQKTPGSAEIDLSKKYYGEVDFRLQYGKLTTQFPWIYPDEHLLEDAAKDAGLQFEVLHRGDRYNFLCCLYV